MIKDSLAVLPMQSERYRARFGFLLFMGTLTVFFLAGMVGYLLIYYLNPGDRTTAEYGVPVSLWISTLFMFGVGYSLHRAIAAVRIERQKPFRRWLYVAGGLALIFLAFQSWGLHRLLAQHQAFQNENVKLYGLMFALALIHALHVVGGMATLAVVTNRARFDVYDHEHFVGVTLCADYWHFLDAVWIVMLLTFALTG